MTKKTLKQEKEEIRTGNIQGELRQDINRRENIQGELRKDINRRGNIQGELRQDIKQKRKHTRRIKIGYKTEEETYKEN